MAQQSEKILKTSPASNARRSVATPDSAAVAAVLRSRKPGRDIAETVWVLFCSIRFAVVLNVTLALAAMLGTVIPQMPAGIQNFQTELDQFLSDAQLLAER